MASRTIRIGGRVFGLGVIAMALACLALGDFFPGQTVAKHFSHRTELAYAAGVFMLLTGLAVEWRRTLVWGAGLLAAYYTLIVVIMMNGRVLLRNYRVYGAYENLAEQLAISAGAVLLVATSGAMRGVTAARCRRMGQLAFGVCALVFGGAHFVYMNYTSPLVPKWLPPTQVFWGYATGTFFLLAGVAILTDRMARVAAILLTVMLASFAVLVHTPMLLAHPDVKMNWTESAVNLAITGAAWVLAESY